MDSLSTGTSVAIRLSSRNLLTKKGRASAFTQQELPAWKPLLTPVWVITIFMVIGIIFIPIGIAALIASMKVVEVVDEYHSACLPSNLIDTESRVQFIQDITTNKDCYRTLKVPRHMKKPIYVYYELTDFYQNHRRYVKSRSDKQLLHGSSVTLSDTDSCKPQQLNGGVPIVPCGLVAWTLFNDTYSFTVGGQPLSVNKKDISWKSDRQHKFGNVYPQNFPNNLPSNQSYVGGGHLDPTIPLNQNEDLIVWMRTAALPTFRKLYGRIEHDLSSGTELPVLIQNNYNTYSFGGKKRLVLSTTTWVGGKNNFLGIAYITVGALCILFALIFFIIQWKYPRPLGDTNYLSWNQKTQPELEPIVYQE